MASKVDQGTKEHDPLMVCGLLNILALILMVVGLVSFYWINKATKPVWKHGLPYLYICTSAVLARLSGRADAGSFLLVFILLFVVLHFLALQAKR